MNAEVEILVSEHDKVLNIPVLAILQYKQKDHVTRKLDDRFVPTEVELGVSNDKFVEVKQGLKEGDVIAMDPESLMSTEERREAFGSAGKGARRDWAKSGPAEEEVKAGAGGAAGAEKKAVVATKPGEPGAGKGAKGAAKGKFAGKGKGKGKGAGGFGNNPIFAKMRQNLSPEELRSMFTASDEERLELQKKAGLTPEEIDQLAQMRQNFGGGGGGGGGGGRGPGGGGGRRSGGGPPGGGDGGGSDQ